MLDHKQFLHVYILEYYTNYTIQNTWCNEVCNVVINIRMTSTWWQIFLLSQFLIFTMESKLKLSLHQNRTSSVYRNILHFSKKVAAGRGVAGGLSLAAPVLEPQWKMKRSPGCYPEVVRGDRKKIIMYYGLGEGADGPETGLQGARGPIPIIVQKRQLTR